MPCDCPEDQPPPTPSGGCNYLVYSGGSLANFYRLVAQAIPDVELVHGRPTAHPDGTLEFVGPPPALAGYRQEGQRLVPAWPPCALRMLKIQVIEGVLSVAGVCGSPTAKQFGLETKPDHCHICRSCHP
jgi:hypothetical protein